MRCKDALLIVLAVLGSHSAAHAFCPFCPPAEPTISEQLARCDVAVLVQWNRLIEQTGELEGAEPYTEFLVLDKPLKAASKPLKPGEKLVVKFRRDGKPGDLLLLIGKDLDGERQWDIKDVTETSYAYVKKAPSLEEPVSKRLAYFLPKLEHPDPLIGNDAFSEFAQAKYTDVEKLALQLPRDKLRNWLMDESAPIQIRHGFYGLLLGLCGNEDDAKYLATRVLPNPDADKPRLGIDGMMAGYVLLTGNRGLQKIVDAKLRVPDRIDIEVGSTINALRFLWEYAAERVPRAEIVKALRLLLNDPKHGETVIVDLARWKDWDSVPTAMALYGQPPFEEALGKQAVVQFALVAQKNLREEKSPPPLLKTVTAFLERTRAAEPEIVQRAEQFVNPPPFPKRSAPPSNPLKGNLDDQPAGAPASRP